MKKLNALFIATLVMGGMILGAILDQAASRGPVSDAQQTLAPAVAHAQALGLGTRASIADIAERVTPSVVSIFTEKEIKVPNFMRSPFFDPFFRGFGPRGQRGIEHPKQQGLGSGVVISSDGIILTNNHVVEAADSIRVNFNDGRDVEAEVIGTDPKSDLAVLRVKLKGLKAMPIADSSKARVGDVVLAIGSPFGLTHSVTMGIISAKGRSNVNITDYEDFIQTDAAINPGNSGGALINMQGKLIGINTAIASRSGGYMGIGFAIPSNMATTVRDSILKNGRMVRGWLGVQIQNLSADLAETMNLKPRSGVLISDVVDGSPADKAGLKRGDLVIAIDGVKVRNSSKLRNLVAGKGAGVSTQLSLLRDGKRKQITVKLGELPDDASLARAASAAGDNNNPQRAEPLAGLHVQNLDAGLRQRLQLGAKVHGVVVVAVDPGSEAAGYGLREGDVIVEVNRRPTSDLRSFKQQMRKAKKKVLLLVHRGGGMLFLAIRR